MLKYAVHNNTELGTSTLVVHYLDNDNGILHSTYIGDSGYIIYRLNENNTYE